LGITFEVEEIKVPDNSGDVATAMKTALNNIDIPTDHTVYNVATVKRRMSELVEKGALTSTRKGKEVYYENSGLYD